MWLGFSCLPWRRSLALRRSSIASRSLSRTSSSVATRVAMRTGVLVAVAHQLAYSSFAVANALNTSPRSFSSDIARSTYGLMLSAAP